ncbi:MAG: pseudouridine synthase [Candidatus Bathyarchaeota archaeon]|nr:pseudouridine synthase [Candidatus Bathyarchaeota archaeon]
MSNKKRLIYGEKSVDTPIRRVRSTADYQFGKGIGDTLFPDNVTVEFSRSTGRIRYINLNGNRIATLRPTDGLLSLSIPAAQSLAKKCPYAHCYVTVRQDIAPFVVKGGDVFAAHVVKADPEIHAKDEVIVLDEAGQVVAVGRAALSSVEMSAFKAGVAVKVRHGRGGES